MYITQPSSLSTLLLFIWNFQRNHQQTTPRHRLPPIRNRQVAAARHHLHHLQMLHGISGYPVCPHQRVPVI